MRLHVNNLSMAQLILTCLFVVGNCSYTLGQTNQCHCAEPPGGSVTCEAGQVPFCIVKDGQVITRCKTPPRGVTSEERQAWLLSEILGREIKVEEVKQKEYAAILQTGQASSSMST